MAQCAFCYTQVDDRATVCPGCGAKRGYGIDQRGHIIDTKQMRRTALSFALGGVAGWFVLGTLNWDKTALLVLIGGLALGAIIFLKSRKGPGWFR